MKDRLDAEHEQCCTVFICTILTFMLSAMISWRIS